MKSFYEKIREICQLIGHHWIDDDEGEVCEECGEFIPSDYDFDDEYCYRCDGLGYIIICCDDLCASNDHCIHGDGEMICPECHGVNYL